MKRLDKLLLTALLLVTGLALHAQRGTISGAVTDPSGSGLIGATVEVLGTTSGTATDINGGYSISINAGNYTVRYAYTGFAAVTRAVTVTAGGTVSINVTLQEDLLGLNEVVILGTRTNDRTVTNSSVPVDVITSREIRATGATQTVQILQALVPSYNTTKPSITDGSDHFRPATLRGLGPDQVLVLVNGKRRHTSALVHVNGTVGRALPVLT
jgi:iron complex outermembrane receptor protein